MFYYSEYLSHIKKEYICGDFMLSFKFFSLFLWALLFYVIVVPGCSVSPPLLNVDTDVLEFGNSLDEQTFWIFNDGGGEMDWKISLEETVPWCSFSPEKGSESGIITVSINRPKVPSGTHSVKLKIESNGGMKEVKILVEGLSEGNIIINILLPPQ